MCGQGLGGGFSYGGGGRVHEVVDLVGSDREGWHEDHHGAERAQDDPVAANDATDTGTDGLLGGVGLGAGASEINADHEAFLADLEDVRER